jgi:predicted PolB exonuclease-like 3'-5' exonuclease
MLITEYGKNFGKIKEIEKLEKGKYEVIGEVDILTQIEQRRPHLVSYNKETNKATTSRPEALQEYINSFKNLKNYKLIFIKI